METIKFPPGTNLLGVNFEGGQWVIRYEGPAASLELDMHGLLSLGEIQYRFTGKQLELLEMLVPVGTAVNVADAVLDLYEPDSDSDDDCMGPLRSLYKEVNQRLSREGFPFAVRMSRGEEPQLSIAPS